MKLYRDIGMPISFMDSDAVFNAKEFYGSDNAVILQANSALSASRVVESLAATPGPFKLLDISNKRHLT
jgi:hypothetical protein